MNKYIIFSVVVAVVLVSVSTYFLLIDSKNMDTQLVTSETSLPLTVNIGVLLPITGVMSSHGQDSNIATQFAAKNFNQYLESVGATWRVNLVMEDSQTDPVIALEKLQSLNSKGIKLVLGPDSSAEVKSIKSYVDSNDMLVLSPSSTAPNLAIDDNIFRLIPDDTKQSVVIAKMLDHYGIKVVIPIYRGDVWGDGLYESTKLSFEAKDGIVDSGIRYSTESTVFSTEVKLLSDSVSKYSQDYSTDQIAVLLIGFTESVHILNSASSYDELNNVRWFGADGTTNDVNISNDRIASEFAQSTNFTSTQFSPSKNETFELVQNHIIDTVGSPPSSYVYSSYDSLWVLGLTIHHTNSIDTSILKQNIPEIASNHIGAIGQINFNEYGDLSVADYELWSIVDGKWIRSGHYNAFTDTLLIDSKNMDTQLVTSETSLPLTVNIGVLLPITGVMSSHGQDSNIATQFAAKNFNQYLESVGATWRVNLVMEDSQTDPVIALEKLQSLNSKGIKLVLGPDSSAEVKSIKSYVDSNDMLVLSPSSTAPNLAIDDNIFRLIPDDTKQSVVIAKMLDHYGIKVVIPIYRGDVWGDGLYESTKLSFEAKDGIVDSGIRYSTESTVFSTEVKLLSDSVSKYSQDYSTDQIAVLLIGFTESVHILNSASSYDELNNVRWFGADGTTNDVNISNDRIASEFAQSTNFTSTQFSPSKNETFELVQNHIIDTVGSPPSSYVYSSYDSLWVLGLTIHHTNSIDTSILKQNIPEIASNHIGAIGQINFNEYGDLSVADYELWSIVDGKWIRSGHYNAFTDTLELF